MPIDSFIFSLCHVKLYFPSEPDLGRSQSIRFQGFVVLFIFVGSPGKMFASPSTSGLPGFGLLPGHKLNLP